ncbi:sugar phosphate isomerase/epimerase [Parabacteroides sp. PF5-5]|uniref:sugar phosphate isomerase/epimerase family protein n=1 Tax=unclassified Parabacteroides TaxID=2649774 RepID=UPI00247431AB|nr:MULTISPECIES: sugar phosphate isomerase/epimerase [unclassified Parabacteroides]MDH6305943.1 sugar phosphate isomerase/epimerase [Parabacteroides sp. PH5-39]MDH6317199.1 sugar phosphate isomerase/epimerase [Parabacteroides sp. PF5-13]MDH6320655.1 sugar phosphate isomerase/epimerase [Parabacteroides sp. PH5-13]MDH6324424.1 sugar phosphate isomerase/epimerase [Parabacteroides sp. PH5-8]MDH6328384.1 sugar phosphate isomerase/epimerase [Parabacteroides sp. PH5-41]
MNRRHFISTTAYLSGLCLLPKFLSACSMQAKLPSFGIITGNTAGKWLEADPQKALETIASLGYKELEFGGTMGMPLDKLKALLKDLKLQALIGPTSMGAMNNPEQLAKDINACHERGQKFIVCYWPWTDDGQNKQADDWKIVADNLNRGGEICRKEGLTLLYHNHDMEFLPLPDGQIPFDVLMPQLNPDDVSIELDLYWIAKGNQSAVEYIQKYPGRYPVFHIKDMDKTAERSFEYVGEGCIDFPSIFRLNKVAGVKHFIVEHDNPADPELCVRTAANYLSKITY